MTNEKLSGQEIEALTLMYALMCQIRNKPGDSMENIKLIKLADAAHNIPLAIMGHPSHRENLHEMMTDVRETLENYISGS